MTKNNKKYKLEIDKIKKQDIKIADYKNLIEEYKEKEIKLQNSVTDFKITLSEYDKRYKLELDSIKKLEIKIVEYKNIIKGYKEND